MCVCGGVCACHLIIVLKYTKCVYTCLYLCIFTHVLFIINSFQGTNSGSTFCSSISWLPSCSLSLESAAATASSMLDLRLCSTQARRADSFLRPGNPNPPKLPTKMSSDWLLYTEDFTASCYQAYSEPLHSTGISRGCFEHCSG